MGKKLSSLYHHTVPHDVAVGTQGSILAMLPTHPQRVPLELCQVRDKDSSSLDSWRIKWLHGLTVEYLHTVSSSVAVPLAGISATGNRYISNIWCILFHFLDGA